MNLLPTVPLLTFGCPPWSCVVSCRPPARDSWLPVLLKLTQHTETAVRTKAISGCCKLATDVEALRLAVERFSVAQLEQLGGTTAADGEVWDANRAQLCFQLHVGLAAPFPGGLRSLAEVYPKIRSKVVKLALLGKVEDLTKEFKTKEGVMPSRVNQDAPELLALLDNLPVGSGDLAIRILNALTKKSFPTEKLIATVRRIYSKPGVASAAFVVPVLRGCVGSKHRAVRTSQSVPRSLHRAVRTAQPANNCGVTPGCAAVAGCQRRR